MTCDCQDTKETQLLKPSKVAASRDVSNSELCFRPALGMSMAASSIVTAMGWTQKYVGDDQKLGKMGFTDLHDSMCTPNGKSFLDACHALNTESETELNAKQLADHIGHFVDRRWTSSATTTCRARFGEWS
eukprot:5267356-Amphidinium_carterae.2